MYISSTCQVNRKRDESAVMYRCDRYEFYGYLDQSCWFGFMSFSVPKASESWSGLCRNMTEYPMLFLISYLWLGAGRTNGQAEYANPKKEYFIFFVRSMHNDIFKL